MTRSNWPHVDVWLGSHHGDNTLTFTESPDRIRVVAPITKDPRPLIWLGVVTRKAVQMLTGQADYQSGVSVLGSEDPPVLCPDAASLPGWPPLPYLLAPGGRAVIIGGRRDDERHFPNAHTTPFPEDPDLVWDLDVLVEEAFCRLTGLDDYEQAIRALGNRDRNHDRFGEPKAHGSAHRTDPFTRDRGWTSETRAPIPRWRDRDPRELYGGLPGQGKRH